VKHVYKISLGSGQFFLELNTPIAFTSMSSRRPNTVVSLVDLGEENMGLLVLEGFQICVEELDVAAEKKMFEEMQARKPKYLEVLRG
jgi:hypothetical protein